MLDERKTSHLYLYLSRASPTGSEPTVAIEIVTHHGIRQRLSWTIKEAETFEKLTKWLSWERYPTYRVAVEVIFGVFFVNRAKLHGQDDLI